MRLILARAGAARTLLIAATLAAAVTTTLLTAFALYAQLLPMAGVRAAVAQAPPAERTVMITASSGATAAEFVARDHAVRELLGGAFAGIDAPVYAAGYSSGQALPEGLAPVEGSAVLAFLSELPEFAELVDGRWPQPGAAGSEPVEVALPATVATELTLAVGDEVAVVDGRASEDLPGPVRVVGVWEPRDAADPYWQLVAAPIERGGWGPFVVHPDDFIARYQVRASLEWVTVPEPDALAEAGMDQVLTDYHRLTDQLTAAREAGSTLDESTRLRSQLDVLAARLDVAAVVNRSSMVLPAALLSLIAAYGLVLVAQLLAAHRRGENALLRARGASRRQLVRITAAEAVLVVMPAAILGAPAATALVTLVDRRAGEQGLLIGPDLAAYGWFGPPLAWMVAVAAAVGCALALALPAAGRGRTWVAEQQERSRPSRIATMQRAGLDGALVLLAILGWTQLRQYGTAVTLTDAGLGIDPLLVAAPVVGVLAVTVVTLRLLPLATRLGVRLAARRNGLPGLLGMWQADRRPHAGPVLLLVLAVAIAVLAPSVASTWQQSQRDQAAHAVGADLRVTVTNPSVASGQELQAAMPAGEVMPVARSLLGLPDAGQTALLAVDTERAARVAAVRPDLTTGPPARMFHALRQGRPELTGAPAPPGAQRLTGRFQFHVPEPAVGRFERPPFASVPRDQQGPLEAELPSPTPGRLSIYLMDTDGVIRQVQLGRPTTNELGLREGGIVLDQAGGLQLDLPLPPDTAALVGLGVGVSVIGFGTFVFPMEEFDPVTVSWSFDDLHWVAAGGVRTRLELPPDWQLRNSERGPQAEWDASRSRGQLVLDPNRDYPSSQRMLLVPPTPRLSVMPVALTPDLLRATGTELGNVINLRGNGGQTTMRVAEVVDAVPGTPTGSGIMIDLAWLSTHQFLQERPTPVVTEWWVAAPPDAAAALAEVSWVGTVHDRRLETQRLLDDPLGTGVLLALWAAAAAAALLAAFGLVVDSRATAVRRRRELAVLHTLGTAPRALARALVVEQAVLAGLGVVAGLAVGVAVAMLMGPSLVLTEAGAPPVPAPQLTLVPAQLLAPAAGLLLVAIALGALVARRARREVATGALRIGDD